MQLMGSGSILREVIAAADILKDDYGVDSDIWSVTSFNEVRKDGYEVSRRNRLKPDEPTKTPYITGLLKDRKGPAVAATDYVRAFADQVREFVPQDEYIVLGTDGFGRSDTRENLRRFFEVDRYQVAWAALVGLNREGKFDDGKLAKARSALNIDPDKPLPTT
ncbi:pyruvate dehydrogenase (acetyl-transferring), homodimeric type, partial [Halorubrum sp. ASP121]